MSPPLSPLSGSALNVQLFSSRELSMVDSPRSPVKASIPLAEPEDVMWDEGPSSPFQTEISVEQIAARKASRESHQQFQTDYFPPIRETEADREAMVTTAPFKIAEDETRTTPTSHRSSMKPRLSEIDSNRPSPSKQIQTTHTMTLEEDTTIKTQCSYKTCDERMTNGEDAGDLTILTVDEDLHVDDTCFSAFSEVPNLDMTAFAKLGQRSPAKFSMEENRTPRPSSRHTPGTARTRQLRSSPRSSSPTPRCGPSVPYVDSNDTTNLLIDFTQQFESLATASVCAPSRSPTRRVSKGGQLLNYLQSQRSPLKHGAAASATPKKNLLNLLDYELPPAPTPRSVPSITIRELESLKSSYASEISNLKATLSGREAEVEALKRSVADAERRVGEATESLREERDKRECVEKDREDWERRGREFEGILKKVKEEVIAGDKDRSELEERVRAAEQRAEEAEKRAVEAATKVVTVPAASETGNADPNGPLFTAEQVQKQIDEKIHALSTELHAIYKKKHVTKVAGLKKGLEAKAKEKTAELQARVNELEKRNDDLQSKIDGTLSGKVILPSLAGVSGEEKEKLKEQSALIERQKAELAGREEELKTAKHEFSALVKELERERIEKGELVAAVDEMLSLQADMSTLTPAAANSAVEDFKKSIGMSMGRPTSGLRGPGFGYQGAPATQQSKIGAPPGLNRSTSGGKSRMMSNIERMGGRAAD